MSEKSNFWTQVISTMNAVMKFGSVSPDKQSIETLHCDDGRNDFLAFSGIAKECKEYWFEMYIGGKFQRKRGYVCQKFDGSWEMVNPIK